MNWCKQEMATIPGAPVCPKSRAFFQQRPTVAIVIPAWYLALVEAARVFVRCGSRLPLLPSPTGAYDWIPHRHIGEVMNRDFDDIDPDLLSDPESFHDDSESSDTENEVEA
jgi:hypothetical protein